MNCTVAQESFDRLTSYWTDPSNRLKWGSVFVLPPWLKVWWQEFRPETELSLSVVRRDKKVVGIAPLQLRDGKASFVGNADVCDYLDFIIAPGEETDFFNTLLDDLQQRGINNLDLGHLRPDSAAATSLVAIAQSRKYEILLQAEEVTLELALPSTWEGYLAVLTKKQRHEVRRKLRRLYEAGNVTYLYIQAGQEEASGLTDTFLKLFSLSYGEKANFMTPRMESFFRSLAEAMAGVGLLRFGILELDKLPVAMVMGFDYNDTMYLYNSAYDPRYDYLSAGLLSKILYIEGSIKLGRGKFDFLKGAEEYKYRLGGKEIPLYNCRIAIN